MLHLTDQEGRGTALEPVVGYIPLVKAFQQAKRIVYIWRLPGEAVAVILFFQLLVHLLGGTLIFLCQHGNVGGHVMGEFILGDAADGRVLGIHRDIRQVVDGGEDAQLRELGDARDETETDHRLVGLQLHIELLHHIAELLQQLRFVKFV